MFAVPGWSVSADSLKPETLAAKAGLGDPGKKSRKRKRASAVANHDVTASNVGELWESVVEGKVSGAPRAKKNKKGSKGESGQAAKPSGEGKLTEQPQQPEKKQRKKSGDKESRNTQDASSPPGKKSSKRSADDGRVQTAAVPAPPEPQKLTPLQASMREKLVSARFRHLNETLYTRPSAEAFNLFQDSPEMFDDYHEGFRRQVKVWPENPVDSFLRDIRSRAKVKTPGKGSRGPQPESLLKTALPRTAGTCTIADLGCGDAGIAQSLQSDAGKLRIDVKSFDLQSPSPLVTKADIANLPAADGSVNVAIFCLALMGTNWIDFVEEANRILHWKGELWIAEIKSRFAPPRAKRAPVNHSLGGGGRKPGKKGGKGGKGGNDAGNDAAREEDLAVEIDGVEDRRRETDVSAFVEVLKKRGFVLQGERGEAVDLSNKMFVKMHFIKGAPPTKGKGVDAQRPPKGKKEAIKWLNGKEEGEAPEIDEASILKPCVYKIR